MEPWGAQRSKNFPSLTLQNQIRLLFSRLELKCNGFRTSTRHFQVLHTALSILIAGTMQDQGQQEPLRKGMACIICELDTPLEAVL